MKQRIVLMLDTYEQIAALDDWTRELAQRLNPNVLFVIAGRAMVNWARKWDSWLMYAQVEEMKPMSKRVMHELIRRYYATMRGGEPDPKQVNAIIEFSGGLPMVVNTAVQLWVKYGVEDFGVVKGEVVREVAARLREGVPSELYPLLETAAALRYFNQDILRAVSGMDDISAGYEELLRFPFVRRRAEGYALHDRVREMIEENVRTDDPAKFRAVHERAAAYFEARMEKVSGEEAERLGLERLYHHVCADEGNGIALFQEMAEGLVRYRLISQLRTVLNDVNNYPIESENGMLWLEYYNARIAQFEIRLKDAMKSYGKISANHRVPSKLQAYALRDLGNILMRPFIVTEPASKERAIAVLERALSFKKDIGTDLIHVMLNLAGVYSQLGEYATAMKYCEDALAFSYEEDDQYAKILSLESSRTLSGLAGNWKEMIEFHNRSIRELQLIGQNLYLTAKIMGGFVSGWVYMGDYAEAEEMATKSIDARREIGDPDLTRLSREAGFAKGFQEKFQEAESYFASRLYAK